jgi:hypothetical protein
MSHDNDPPPAVASAPLELGLVSSEAHREIAEVTGRQAGEPFVRTLRGTLQSRAHRRSCSEDQIRALVE